MACTPMQASFPVEKKMSSLPPSLSTMKRSAVRSLLGRRLRRLRLVRLLRLLLPVCPRNDVSVEVAVNGKSVCPPFFSQKFQLQRRRGRYEKRGKD